LKNIGFAWPPYSTGQHMLIQPWAASARRKGFELAPDP
jgi:hypothetical protein